MIKMESQTPEAPAFKNRRSLIEGVFSFRGARLVIDASLINALLFIFSHGASVYFSTDLDEAAAAALYSTRRYLGLLAAVVSLPLATIPSFDFLSTALLLKSQKHRILALAIGGLSSASVARSFSSEPGVSEPFQCSIVLCAFDESSHDAVSNGTKNAFGVVATLLSAVLCAAFLVGLLKETKSTGHQGSSLSLPLVDRPARVARHTSATQIAAIAGASALPALTLLASSLSPSTFHALTKYDISKLAWARVGITLEECTDPTRTCPEIPGAWMRTTSLEYKSADDGRRAVVGKLFVDVLLFISMVYALLMASAVAARVRARPRRTRQLLAGVFVFFFALNAAHWVHDHNWRMRWPRRVAELRPPSSWEQAARTLGQLSNYLLGTLLLPVSKRSLFGAALGVDHRHLIVYHKILGYAFLAAVTAHILAWWAVFVERRVWTHDGLSVWNAHVYFPFNSTAGRPVGNDFTVPLANNLWFFVIFPVFALSTRFAVRRANFELFKRLHVFGFLILLSLVALHASAVWVYVSIGVVLYICDALYRTLATTMSVEASCDVVLNVVRISYPCDTTLGGGYCFINVAQVKPLEWHPITIADFDSQKRTHYVHPTGAKDSWSRSLLTRVSNGGEVDVLVDGPYGTGLEFERYSGVVFVVGGVGCAPMLSLVEAAKQTGANCRIKVLWSVRTLAQRRARYPTLEADVDCTLFCTQDRGGFRMDVAKELTNAMRELGESPLVFACGPTGLTDAAEKWCAQQKHVECRVELFEL